MLQTTVVAPVQYTASPAHRVPVGEKQRFIITGENFRLPGGQAARFVTGLS
jgi:hypothetical protein